MPTLEHGTIVADYEGNLTVTFNNGPLKKTLKTKIDSDTPPFVGSCQAEYDDESALSGSYTFGGPGNIENGQVTILLVGDRGAITLTGNLVNFFGSISFTQKGTGNWE
jgi:hypothetical protein